MMKHGFSLATIIALPVVRSLRADPFNVDWFNRDGGGMSTGGVFSFTDTIGQPDAGRLLALGSANFSFSPQRWLIRLRA